MLILIIAGGPDKGRIYELTDGAPIVLGREGDQVKLNDRKVSREHARLWSEGGQWYLKDLGSRHGTYRNHAELEKGQRAKLKDGDYLQIGNTVMVLGRMTAAQSERMAMPVGSAPGVSRNWNKPTVIAGSLAVVAVLGLGGYVAAQLHALRSESVPQAQIDRMEDELLAMKNQSASDAERIAATAEQMTASLDQTAEQITGAKQTIERVRDPLVAQLESAQQASAEQRLALAAIGDALAKQQAQDNSAQVLAAVSEMQRLLADQPTGDALIATLQQAIDANADKAGEIVRVALAEHRDAVKGDALASAQATQTLFNRVLEDLAKVPTREQLAEEVRLAVAEATQQKDEQFMRLVLAELRRTGDQIAADLTAAVDEDAKRAQALMQQVVAELDKRPTGEQLAGELRGALDEALADRDANNAALPSLMREVLSELEQRPTSEQLAADLRRVIGEDAQRTELLIARVMTGIDERPTAAEIASELQATDNETAARTATLIEQVLERVEAQGRLADQIAQLRERIEAMPGTNRDAVRQVLTRLDEQDENNTAMLAAIADLRRAVPGDLSGQLDQVLTQLDEQVRTAQITDAIEASMQRIAAAENKKTEDAIAELTRRIDALPSGAQLAKLADTQTGLAKLLDESDSRQAIGELRQSLEQLADRLDDSGGDDRLDTVIAMLKQREKTELLIAELHDAMATDADDTDQLKKQLLAALDNTDPSNTSEKLNELLAIVRTRLVTEASVRQAIRDEMRSSVLPNQKALDDARDVTSTTSLAAEPGDDPTPAVRPRRLTRLESAYKQSFETSRPMTVGAGIVDPKTGEISKGRRIDPEVAKALGFETWRDWYLTDRHAEQMRIQREALRQRNASEARDGGAITLPPADSAAPAARPEQD
ncbi:MAG: FHA domain-containing protein [Phycisphaeraceae bacterium]